jgi:hypothetical protein
MNNRNSRNRENQMQTQKPTIKYIPNEVVQDNSLYGELKEDDIVKKYLTADIIKSFQTNSPILIPGEENLGIQKVCFGGMIITTESIGERCCHNYNLTQKQHIKNKTLAHKSLCERNDEATSLLFLTLRDFVGDVDYKSLNNKELCNLVQNNIQQIVEEKLPWVINYSKHIVRDYYSLPANRLKIKLNFILDDGIYDESEPGRKVSGGLLVNGFLKELEYYDNEWGSCMNEEIGIICQVLSPTGLPRNKKWIQIDVGISFIGKRHYGEDIVNATIRQAKSDIRLSVHPDVIKMSIINNNIYYGSLPNGAGYEGYEIYIWEVLYPDQLQIEEEKECDSSFCKCSERYASIDIHKQLLRF